MLRFLCVVVLCSIPVSVFADDVYPCEIHRIVDGDTIEASLTLNYHVGLLHRMFRLTAYDSWEARRGRGEISDEELIQGRLATTALRELVNKSKAAFIAPPELSRAQQDAYGRPLGRLYLRMPDGELLDVASYMIANDHDRDRRSDGTLRE